MAQSHFNGPASIDSRAHAPSKSSIPRDQSAAHDPAPNPAGATFAFPCTRAICVK
jgi:hypothetical protein